MTANEINKAIRTMKVHFSKGEKLEHWVNFILLLVPIYFLGFLSFEYAIKNNEITFSVIIIISIVAFILKHKITCSNFKGYKSNLTTNEFKQSNLAAAELNDWRIIENTDDYFSAIISTLWQWHGVKITAIHKNGKLYLNSMVNPSLNSSPITLGLNKRSKLQLLKQYQLALKGVNVSLNASKEIERKEKEFWSESEWTLSNTIKRIFLYGLSIPFLIVAIWGMIDGGPPNAYVIGPPILAICGSYIFFDLKVIIEKRKKKKKGHNTI
jgi:hypothetical protein